MATLDALLSAAVHTFRDRAAISWQGQELSYGALGAAADRLARRLEEAGIGAGQRVAVIAPNVPAVVVALFAGWRCGAVLLPLNARWRDYDLGRTLADADISAAVSVEAWHGYSFAEFLSRKVAELPTLRRCLFVDALGEVVGELAGRAVPAEPQEEDVGLILYTSGTTGAPKGALVRHSREIAGAENLNGILDGAPQDVCVFVIPITHAFGLTCALAALSAGSQLVMIESTFSLEPLVTAVREHAATVLHGSPPLFAALAKLEAGPRLQTGFVAGAPCPPAVLEKVDRTGFRLHNLYGMTEIGAAACTRSADPPAVRHSSVGGPLMGYEIRVNAEREGEIQVRGPHVTPGYFRHPEETAAAFEDGWFRTGDIGWIDPGGNVHVSGRAKDVVTVGGFNVFPAEVEGLLLTHPDVVQAAVVGAAGEAMGGSLHAFVVPRSGADLTPAALLQFARTGIAGYKLPYRIEILPELPLLASGKPDRAALKQRVEGERRAAC